MSTYNRIPDFDTRCVEQTCTEPACRTDTAQELLNLTLIILTEIPALRLDEFFVQILTLNVCRCYPLIFQLCGDIRTGQDVWAVQEWRPCGDVGGPVDGRTGAALPRAKTNSEIAATRHCTHLHRGR